MRVKISLGLASLCKFVISKKQEKFVINCDFSQLKGKHRQSLVMSKHILSRFCLDSPVLRMVLMNLGFE